MLPRSIAFGQLAELAAVEASWGFVVDIFHAGLLAQLGVTQPRRQPPGRDANEAFAFEQPARAIRMARDFCLARASTSTKALAMP